MIMIEVKQAKNPPVFTPVHLEITSEEDLRHLYLMMSLCVRHMTKDPFQSSVPLAVCIRLEQRLLDLLSSD